MSQDILNLEEDLKELQYFAETDNKAALMVKITEMQKENNKNRALLSNVELGGKLFAECGAVVYQP